MGIPNADAFLEDLKRERLKYEHQLAKSVRGMLLATLVMPPAWSIQ